MNLIYLHKKGDPALKLGEGVAARQQSVSGRNYEGFILPKGPAGELRLSSALRWHPFASRPITTGWLAVTQGRSAIDLEIALVDQHGNTVSRVIDRIGAGPSVVSLPRLSGPSTQDADCSLDLVLRNRGRSPIMLLVTERDSPKPFLGLAQGLGVELLSGDSASLPPTRDRDIFYVGSESQVEAVGRTQSKVGQPWRQAIVGAPHDVPLVDEGLDFIFAANILHRAVNPLGHLAKWRAKLRPDGRVLGIVPYVAGGGDYVNAPSTMAEWLREYEGGGFEELQAHHNAFAHARGLNPKSLFRRRYPSSFSFFTPSNVADMLKFAIERLGYRGMHIEHARNGRDIRFGLYA
jgi:hypothetical protein